MNMSEEEYRKMVFWMIGISGLILVVFVSLLLYMYRGQLISGDIPRGRDDSSYSNSYNDYSQYNDYNQNTYPQDNPQEINTNTDDKEYIEPENRTL